MAWLSGWDNRIKLTIDNTKIDSALSHFPVTVFLSSTHGDCVFDELTADANRFKIAFTKADGTTQLYGEIELWDDAGEKAIIHVSRDGWAIADDADTEFYMYYDVDHADNTTYIGDIDSTPGAAVWDANYKLVYHMVDATTSAVKDSTSNNNDGTKKAANEPIEAAGKIGLGQDFDGIDDYIDAPVDSDLYGITAITVDAVVCSEELGETSPNYGGVIMSTRDSSDQHGWSFEFRNDVGCHKIMLQNREAAGGDLNTANDAWVADTQYYVTMTHVNNTSQEIFLDGVSKASSAATWAWAQGDNAPRIGQEPEALVYEWKGLISEFRVSNVKRADSWVKATYNSLWDSLLTYGGSELKKELSESFSAADSLVKNGTEQLAEAFSIVDSWLPRVYLSEAFSIADSLVKSGIEQLAEAFSIVDSWVARLNLSESFSAADSLVKNGTEQLAESVSISDSLIKNAVEQLAESFSIVDSWFARIRSAEAVKVVDSIIKKHVITMMIRKIIIRVRGGSYESDIELED